MSLAVLALFERALRIDARQPSTYVLRGALLAIILSYLAFTQRAASLMGAPGLALFSQLAMINFFFITLGGLSTFASVITEEKEEMTLGLLRMTALSPLAILLGKATSRLVGVLFLLLVQFPFTLLAVTLGGVSTDQVIAVYTTLLAYTILLSNVALLFSVVGARTRTAVAATAVFLAVFFFGPAVCRGLLGAMLQEGWIARSGNFYTGCVAATEAVANASPHTRIIEIMVTGFGGSAIGYQVVTNTVAGLLFFLLGWAVFERFNRELGKAGPARDPVFKASSRLARLGVGRAWAAALVWKDFFFLTGGKLALIAKFLLYAMLLGVICWYSATLSRGAAWQSRTIGNIMMGTMMIVLLVELALVVSRLFATEIRWRTLGSLMALPLAPRQVAYRKLAGSMITLLPGVTYFLIGALLAPRDFGQSLEGLLKHPTGWYVVSQLLLFYHLIAFLSLVVRRGALALAVVIVFLGNQFLVMFLMIGFGARSEGSFAFLTLVTIVVTAVIHVRTGHRLELKAAE